MKSESGNNSVGKLISELRGKKGYSQEELAEMSRLSLRTIQRMESGEASPRGDTIRRIAAALSVPPDELMNWDYDKHVNTVLLMSLTQLGFLAFPVLSVLLPLVFWIKEKNRIKDVYLLGLSILNFQISWNILFFGATAVAILVILLRNKVDEAVFYTWLSGTVVLYLYNAVLVIANTLRYRRGQSIRYGPAFDLLR